MFLKPKLQKTPTNLQQQTSTIKMSSHPPHLFATRRNIRDDPIDWCAWMYAHLGQETLRDECVGDIKALWQTLDRDDKFKCLYDWTRHYVFGYRRKENNNEDEDEDEVDIDANKTDVLPFVSRANVREFWKNANARVFVDWCTGALDSMTRKIQNASHWTFWWDASVLWAAFPRFFRYNMKAGWLKNSTRHLNNQDFALAHDKLQQLTWSAYFKKHVVLEDESAMRRVLEFASCPMYPHGRNVPTAANLGGISTDWQKKWQQEWDESAKLTQERRQVVTSVLVHFLPLDVCVHVIAKFIYVPACVILANVAFGL